MAQQPTATTINGIGLETLQNTVRAIEQDPSQNKCKFRAKADAENVAKLRRLAEFSPVLNTLTYGGNVKVEVEPM